MPEMYKCTGEGDALFYGLDVGPLPYKGESMAKKKESKSRRNKVATVMEEFKKGTLNIGKSKKKVKNRKQAIAIALSEARRAGEDVTSKRRRKKKVKPIKKSKKSVVKKSKKRK